MGGEFRIPTQEKYNAEDVRYVTHQWHPTQVPVINFIHTFSATYQNIYVEWDK